MILAGDAGGTKTNLALFEAGDGGMTRGEVGSFPSREYPSVESILTEFLAGKGPVDFICLGVAGPVRKGRSRLTNLPWTVEEDAIRRASGAKRGFVVNDLQATAFAVPFLPPDRFAVLQQGEAEADGSIVVAAAGTGLGVGYLVRAGEGYHPFASEGGHAGLAPRNDREEKLLTYLKTQHGRASTERAVSGPGLHAIYRFLRESEGASEIPEVDDRLLREDPPRVIAEEGLSGRSMACRETIRFFASLYGSFSGDLALMFYATGGVVLGGGIAPAILPALSDGRFLEAFADKGRFRDFLSGIPVKVILDDKAALLGAAHYAAAMAGAEI